MQQWSRTTFVGEGKGISPDKEPPEGGVPVGTDNYSYVQLTAVHEYTYPMMDDRQKVLHGMRRESAESLKKFGGGGTTQQPPLPVKASGRKGGYSGNSSRRARCKYCQEVFTVDLNRRGACDYAPDKMRNLMDRVSCMQAAQCMTYHCMADSEGDFVQRPCQCGTPGDDGCTRRWFGLSVLSLLVPCLCLYPPLRACHWCCVSCGACGGRHVAADQ
jgi:sprouty-related EVH1 domain-containing protein